MIDGRRAEIITSVDGHDIESRADQDAPYGVVAGDAAQAAPVSARAAAQQAMRSAAIIRR